MSKTLNNFYAFKFVRLLSQDWTDTEAYEEGIIDENGKVIKKNLTTDEKRVYTKFHKLVFNIKRMLEKFPLGKHAVSRYATALLLLKESTEYNENIEQAFYDYLSEQGNNDNDINLLKEETMTTGIDMGVHKKKEETFAGSKVFDCDSDTFQNCRLGKKKYARYKTYVGEDEIGQEIKAYALKNPKKQIVLRDSKTGAMIYLRRT